MGEVAADAEVKASKRAANDNFMRTLWTGREKGRASTC
jgi:hypothetical protein